MAHHFEALVIGSGFGGAVAACRLAQVGYDVAILERGRRYGKEDFPSLPPEGAFLPDARRWSWQHSEGLWDVQDLDEIVAVQAAGYGGGSLVYANVHLRPPDEVFESGWPNDYTPARLREYFNLGAYMMDPAPATEHPDFEKWTKSSSLRGVMNDLGRSAEFSHPPLAVRMKPGANRQGQSMNACTGCGRCCGGCPIQAKNTLDFNYLAVAERHGARVHTQCEVKRLEEQKDKSWVVEVFDHLEARAKRFTAETVFLCAGSVHTTRLLAGAKLEDPEVQRPDRLGVAYFPGGDSLGVVFDTEQVQDPTVGPAITTSTAHWRSESSFFQIQDGGYPAELDYLVGLLRAPIWLGRNRHTRAADVPRPKKRTTPEGPPLVTLMPSPLDAVLDAHAGSRECFEPRERHFTIDDIIPKQLREAIPHVLEELKEPLLLREVVGGTIEQALRDSHRRSWLTRRFDPEGWLLRTWRSVVKWAIEALVASNEEFASHAIKQLATAAGSDRNHFARRVLGWDASRSRYRAVLLGMGCDSAAGTLRYDPETDRLTADLMLSELIPGYSDQERLMADVATKLGGELRTNPGYSFLGKPITVHNQGGCPMTDDAGLGVTDPNGKVFGCERLYVMDGSVFCKSVGVNPSATIIAVTERNIGKFIETQRQEGKGPKEPNPDGQQEYDRAKEESKNWDTHVEPLWNKDPNNQVRLSAAPKPAEDRAIRAGAIGIEFREVMQGFYHPEADDPGTDADAVDAYRESEIAGRPTNHIELKLEVSTENLHQFFQDKDHELHVSGTATLGGHLAREAKVKGKLRLIVRHDPLRSDAARDSLAAHCHFMKRAMKDARPSEPPSVPSKPADDRMEYDLVTEDGLRIEGFKLLRDDPGVDAWRDTSSLYTRILRDHGKHFVAAGVVHVDLPGFLFSQVPSMTVTSNAAGNSEPLPSDDPRSVWALAAFNSYFFGSLQRIYAPEFETLWSSFFRFNPTRRTREPARGTQPPRGPAPKGKGAGTTE